MVTPGAGPALTADNGTYIVDGHHRWSAIYLINPDAQIQAQDLGYVPDPKVALKQTQFGIAATTGQLEESAAGQPNVYDVTRELFDTKIVEYIAGGPTPDVVIATFGENLPEYKDSPEAWAALTDPEKIEKIQDFIWKNVELMRTNNPFIDGATSRRVMPQIPRGKQDDVLNNLAGVTNKETGNSGVSFSFPIISYLG